MSKYAPLQNYLVTQAADELHVTFSDVEKIIGKKLPASAFKYREWWANDAKGHVHAKAWLEAGFQTVRVNMEERKLTFKRMKRGGGLFSPAPTGLGGGFRETVARGYGGTQTAQEDKAMKLYKDTGRHPAFGALKGALSLDPDFDATEPAMPDWPHLIDTQYGPEPE